MLRRKRLRHRRFVSTNTAEEHLPADSSNQPAPIFRRRVSTVDPFKGWDGTSIEGHTRSHALPLYSGAYPRSMMRFDHPSIGCSWPQTPPTCLPISLSPSIFSVRNFLFSSLPQFHSAEASAPSAEITEFDSANEDKLRRTRRRTATERVQRIRLRSSTLCSTCHSPISYPLVWGVLPLLPTLGTETRRESGEEVRFGRHEERSSEGIRGMVVGHERGV